MNQRGRDDDDGNGCQQVRVHAGLDPGQAKDFYTKLFGWSTEIFKAEGMDYAMINANGQNHGGFGKAQEERRRTGSGTFRSRTSTRPWRRRSRRAASSRPVP